MAIICTISEVMSGQIQIDGQAYDISLHLDAFSDDPLAITQPRPFTGYCYWKTVNQQDQQTLLIHAEGTLTILPSGPAYDIHLKETPIGDIQLKGKKQYQLKGLIKSLTHCPLVVINTNDGTAIGTGEIAYRKPLWKFPLESVRFTRNQSCY